MFPVLYEQVNNVGTVPTNNGLGLLTDAIECMVTEERNGSYELELKYPTNGIHSKELIERRIIKAKPNYTDDSQLFRIYKIGKVLNDTFTVYARHISYDLSGYSITSGSATNATLACALLQSNASGWTIETNKSVTATFKIIEPSSVRSWFGGKEGSFLDVFGTGEWKYNNFTCSFLQSRGSNRGVVVKYAKNLLSLSQDIDSSNVITGVIAFWKDSQSGTVVVGNTQSTSVTLDVPNVYTLDCSSDFRDAPTVAQLNTKAQNYINNHENAFAKQNIKLNFLQLGLLKDRVDLCDIVTIEYPDFGISGVAKCITTTWDVLKDRYDSIEIGEPKTNIADTIVSLEKKDKSLITPTEMNGAIDRATALITGNTGGYVVLHDSNADEMPDELLIMNTPDIATATKVWRWNLSGLGYSSTGYSGTFGLAMTMEGEIDCAFLKTGNLVFGGTSGNSDGTLSIKDANNNTIANFNKSGCTVKGNIYATSFVADAGPNTEISIGAIASGQGYEASNGIYIYDENISTDNPRVKIACFNINNFLHSSYIQLGDTKQNSYLGPLVEIYAGQNLSNEVCDAKLLLMGKYGSNSAARAIILKSHQGSNNTTDRVWGSIEVRGITSGYDFKYDGGNAPKDIYLGGLKFTNGGLYGTNTGDFKRISVYDGKILIDGNNNGGHIGLRDSNDKTRVGIFGHSGVIALSDGSTNNNNRVFLDGSDASISLQDSGGVARGQFQLDSSGNGTFYLFKSNASTSNIGMSGNSGNITCVSLTQTSTKKVKKNINELSDTEAKKILDITPVTYDFKDEDYGTDKRGFIAEDVDKVIPNIVTKDEDNNPQGINYTEIIPYLTKMVQMQQKQIELLEARVKELEERGK